MRIARALGVVDAHADSALLAEVAAELARAGRALDLGTGSGYVAIALARRGLRVDAVDVSPRALALARRNAAANGVAVRIFSSDWFAAVTDTYDVIACNPPMRAGETERSRLVTATLRRFPALAYPLHRLTQPWLEPGRAGLLTAIVAGARRHLAEGGLLLLVISPRERRELLARTPGLVEVLARAPRGGPPNLDVVALRFAR
jgi:release factor glutamine methyltransferase